MRTHTRILIVPLFCTRPLQELPCLNEYLEGSMLSISQKSKRKKRECFGDGLDTENTPHELIHRWSPPHKQRVVCKGKENEENQFVLARRPRKRREFSGVYRFSCVGRNTISSEEHLLTTCRNISGIMFQRSHTFLSYWCFYDRLVLGHTTRWVTVGDPFLPSPAGPPPDVPGLQALASLGVSLGPFNCLFKLLT